MINTVQPKLLNALFERPFFIIAELKTLKRRRMQNIVRVTNIKDFCRNTIKSMKLLQEIT